MNVNSINGLNERWNSFIKEEFESSEKTVEYLLTLAPELRELLLHMEITGANKMPLDTSDRKREHVRINVSHKDIKHAFIMEYIPGKFFKGEKDSYDFFNCQLPIKPSKEHYKIISNIFVGFDMYYQLEEIMQ